MRVILDTNVLVSGLLAPLGVPGSIYQRWRNGRFTLLISEEQLRELRNTLRKPTLRQRIAPHRVGRLVNDLRELGEPVKSFPHPKRSPDSEDNYLLAMSQYGNAAFLVTGDKSHLLALASHEGTASSLRATSLTC
jgi:putative PIN family toxin of toxin-antitoxin system